MASNLASNLASKWWEIEIHCDPSLEDHLVWRLDQLGCRGMASQWQGPDFTIKTYLPQLQATVLDLGALALQVKQAAQQVNVPEPTVRWTEIAEEDWASGWKQHWEPQEIGDRFLIRPAWIDPPQTDRLILSLDPGVAFGTGAHQTTQLCLESLEMRLPKPQPEAVLADIGCGSGILAIGALLLGAGKVYGVDTDPLAVQSAEDNAQLNGIGGDRLITGLGSLKALQTLLGEDQKVDGFVCNILAEVIVKLIPDFASFSKPQTWGVLSGILVTQAQMVATALEQNGWIAATLWKRQDWCCFNIRRDLDA